MTRSGKSARSRSTAPRWLLVLRQGTATAILGAAVWFAAAHPVQAGINVWTSHGPEGGTVQALALDPTTPATLYAGTTQAVFKSTNAGGTWSATALIDTSIWSLAIDLVSPMTLYAGTYSNGIYKTTDAGGTWVSIGPNDTTVWEIAIDPTTPTTLYAAADSGVFKSTNGGASWDPTALMNTPLQALAIDPTEPTTLYAGGGGVFKSTDGGGTWRSTGLMGDETVAVSVYELAIDLITPATLYAGAIVANCSPFGCGRGGRYLGKTTDGGDTWTVTPGPAHVPALTIDPTAPMTLYAGGAGVSKSTDGGSTWKTLNTGLINTDVRALVIDPITPRRVYAATADGVFAIEQVRACMGDCAVDGGVTINEVMTLVNIALGTTPMVECGSGDANGDATGDPIVPYPLHSVAARAGYPVITVPAGFARGLPVGISFVGGAFSEPTLIRLAYAFEQVTHARRVPQFLPHEVRPPSTSQLAPQAVAFPSRPRQT